MNKELLGVGRGYLIVIIALGMMFALVLTDKLDAKVFMESVAWMLPLVVGAKEGGKAAMKIFTKKPKGEIE